MKNQTKQKKSGQAMVEYIIIVVIVAIAAIAVFGVFSDRIREMLGGATTELGGEGDPNSETSVELMQGLSE